MSTETHGAELSRSLFVAARKRAPAPEVRERVLERMLDEHRARPKSRRLPTWAFVPVLAAAAAVVLWVSPQPREEPSIKAERGVAVPSAPPTASEAVNETLKAPRAVPAPLPEVPKETPMKRALPEKRAVEKPASLAEEVALLDRVKKALDAGDAGQALKLLAPYQKPRGRRLTAEATVLRIEALAKAGQSAEASRLAEDFLDRHPHSPLVDRARSYVLTDP
jgi:hypothetical protein